MTHPREIIMTVCSRRAIVSSVSFVSTTNTANSLAGFVSPALALEAWRSGRFGEALSGLVGRHRSVIELTADRPLEHGRVNSERC